MSHERKKSNSSTDTIGDIRHGFDGLLGALGDVISEVSERLEAGEAREVHKSFEVETGKGPVRAEAGVRVRFADGAGGARSNSRASMARAVNPERKKETARATEPMPRAIDFEIFEDESIWLLIADIPGVDREELKLSEADGDLVIETIGARRFRATCALPEGIRAASLNVSLRNGILELTANVGDAEGE